MWLKISLLVVILFTKDASSFISFLPSFPAMSMPSLPNFGTYSLDFPSFRMPLWPGFGMSGGRNVTTKNKTEEKGTCYLNTNIWKN